jgi:hypothetical protein
MHSNKKLDLNQDIILVLLVLLAMRIACSIVRCTVYKVPKDIFVVKSECVDNTVKQSGLSIKASFK